MELILLRVDAPASYSGDNRVGVDYLNHIEVASVSGLLERDTSRNTPSIAQVIVILRDWGRNPLVDTSHNIWCYHLGYRKDAR